MSLDIVFLRSWYPVSVPRLYNPVTSLLMPVGQKHTWSGMRTLGQLKYDLGIHNKPKQDSLYKVRPFIEKLIHIMIICCRDAQYCWNMMAWKWHEIVHWSYLENYVYMLWSIRWCFDYNLAVIYLFVRSASSKIRSAVLKWNFACGDFRLIVFDCRL